MMRRTLSGNAKKRHAPPALSYRGITLAPVAAASKASSPARPASASLARYIARSAGTTGLRSFQDTNSNEWRIRCTIQVCTTVCRETALIASGKPFRPVHDGDQVSATPRFLNADRLVAKPLSGTLTRMASKKTKGKQASSGLFCHSATSSSTASVTAEIRSGETSMHRVPSGGADLAHAHAVRIHGYDLGVEIGKAALILGDQIRVEGAGTVTRDPEFDLRRARQNSQALLEKCFNHGVER